MENSNFNFFKAFDDNKDPDEVFDTPMVLILDGNSEHVVHAGRKKSFFWGKYQYYDTSRSNKCLKQIKQPKSLNMHAPTYIWITIKHTYHDNVNRKYFS